MLCWKCAGPSLYRSLTTVSEKNQRLLTEIRLSQILDKPQADVRARIIVDYVAAYGNEENRSEFSKLKKKEVKESLACNRNANDPKSRFSYEIISSRKGRGEQPAAEGKSGKNFFFSF